jgi:hypothetical protein
VALEGLQGGHGMFDGRPQRLAGRDGRRAGNRFGQVVAHRVEVVEGGKGGRAHAGAEPRALELRIALH